MEVVGVYAVNLLRLAIYRVIWDVLYTFVNAASMNGSQSWSRQVVILNMNPSEDTVLGSTCIALLLWFRLMAAANQSSTFSLASFEARIK